jgi:HD-like signal output (HDOD) protein
MYHQPSFLDVIEEYLESEEIRLPAFSQNALRIQKEAFSAEPDFLTIRELIECDQALTSQVIRKANTAFYRGLTKVNTVHEAILRVGTGQVASIVMMITQKTNYESKDPLISEYIKRLWNHSLAVANASNWLAERCGYPNLMDRLRSRSTARRGKTVIADGHGRHS